ncbi:lantibiotic dehydratase C-terminal domain-containing protein [Actinomyces trachealis]|uniref:lantibiotic dehydratase C-terminal domain-containing protein n=1 Tax=Actinomyces trachealis TaxID=2763540 RepID=UPI0018C7DB84|nr:lantibiotic dehydratase C-terminal domain-containing protein [Actinomyces trachealis]
MSAIDYIGAVEREGGFEQGALRERIAARWANRLRYGGLEPDKLRRRAPILNEFLRARARLPADWTELVQLTCRILAKRSASAAPDFPLDLVHMHINRIGLNPLEECMAAHLCETSPTTEGDTYHDRRKPRAFELVPESWTGLILGG